MADHNLARMMMAVLMATACASAQQAADGKGAGPDVPRSEVVVGGSDSVWEYIRTKYDADGDGGVSSEEYTRDADRFRRLDRNGDGAIREDDFQARGRNSSMMGIMVLVRYFQEDDSMSDLARQELAQAFTGYDGDGDGKIGREEFDKHLAARGTESAPFGMDRFGALLSAADRDGDERVGRDEILAFFDGRDSDGNGIWEMRGPPQAAEREEEQDSSALAGKGKPAPDFELAPLHEGDPVSLSSFAGKKPVALIFGSYT